MNQLTIYHSTEDYNDFIEDFIQAFQGRKMTYLASDLLKEGLAPQEVMSAVEKAMESCRAAGLDVSNHFRMVYTMLEGAIVRDCKLTSLGYAWVMMHGPSDNPTVANWQLQLIRNTLRKRY